MPNIGFPEGVPSPFSTPIGASFQMNFARLVLELRTKTARQVFGASCAVVEIHRAAQPGAGRKKT